MLSWKFIIFRFRVQNTQLSHLLAIMGPIRGH